MVADSGSSTLGVEEHLRCVSESETQGVDTQADGGSAGASSSEYGGSNIPLQGTLTESAEGGAAF